MYWRSSPRSVGYYLVFGIFSLFVLYLVETCKQETVQPHFEKKLQAAKIALQAFQEIRKIRLERNKEIRSDFDPSGYGLIGEFFTPVTSNLGVLRAKQISINPNFAALVLDYLIKAGVQKGDTVAVAFSGSFPALNICVYAAAKVLDLRVVSISSLSSSQWGANDPEFLWVDMERELEKRNILPYRSLALSLGGVEDRALGIPKEGISFLERAALRNSKPLLKSSSYSDSLEERRRLYESVLPISQYKAYINVGGGTVSVGSKSGSREFVPGLNLKLPIVSKSRDSLMKDFSKEGVPVLHLVSIESIAKENGFPTSLKEVPLPGEGKIFKDLEYNRWLVLFALVCELALLYVFFKTDSFLEEDKDQSL
ncbi:poly-gamma-glutamate system protein [Leptospira semungkisensis]|nr:poly-gamma-glutamate system protein [Leptospira semungkisensis]